LEAAYFDADTVIDCLENLQCSPTNFGIFALGRRRAQRLHGGLANVLQSLGGCLALGELEEGAAEPIEAWLAIGRNCFFGQISNCLASGKSKSQT
jgi:hypothetical protein